MPETITPGQIAQRRHFRMVDIFLLSTLVLVLVALASLFGTLQDIQQNQAEGKERTFQSRAVICDMTAALGLTPNPECNGPEVMAYRDETAATTGTTGARNSKATLNAVCHLAARLGELVPECEPEG